VLLVVRCGDRYFSWSRWRYWLFVVVLCELLFVVIDGAHGCLFVVVLLVLAGHLTWCCWCLLVVRRGASVDRCWLFLLLLLLLIVVGCSNERRRY